MNIRYTEKIRLGPVFGFDLFLLLRITRHLEFPFTFVLQNSVLFLLA